MATRALRPDPSVPVVDLKTGLMTKPWFDYFVERDRPIPGWSPATGILSRATFDPATVTLNQLGQRVACIIYDDLAKGVRET